MDGDGRSPGDVDNVTNAGIEIDSAELRLSGPIGSVH